MILETLMCEEEKEMSMIRDSALNYCESILMYWIISRKIEGLIDCFVFIFREFHRHWVN